MGKPHFSFKQFSLAQDRCAMKVGTDGVALGAWTPVAGVRRILDIGTGTGLIALMLAQRSEPQCQIVAVELDADAAAQAAENVAHSPWSQRIQVVAAAIQDLQAEPFDLIVSNPPFFVHGQPFACSARQQARHTSTLSHVELLQHALRLMTPSGRMALVLPIGEAERFMDLAAQSGLGVELGQRLIPRPGKDSNRFLLLLSRCNGRNIANDIVICSESGDYSDIYGGMVRDFYLKL
jgi:tRNA1Val (adenine37-N6)-methyltransferase